MTVSCPNCGASCPFLLRSRDYNARVSEDTFDYHRCSACGVVAIAQVPEHLERFYSSAYIPYRMPPAEELDARAQAEKYKMELIKPFARAGRLLEIGPSWGGFAYLARQAGYAVDAIEMDPACCEYLERVVGVNVYRGADILAVLPALQRFDVIAFWHSIEHLPNPFHIIDEAVAHLSPGGLLVVATPNPESLQFRVLRGRWVHLDAPRHLHLIPAETLRRRLARLELQLVHQTLDDWAGRVLNRMGWQSSIVNMTTAGVSRFAARVAARLLAEVMTKVDRWSGRGAAYTAIFQRAGAV